MFIPDMEHIQQLVGKEGCIAKWAKQDRVYYVIVSSGEKGTWDKDVSPLVSNLQKDFIEQVYRVKSENRVESIVNG